MAEADTGSVRTTLVGSWPAEDRFAPDLARYHRGELSSGAAEAVLTRVAAVAIAQQRQCGVDQITGGETSADSFILHFPRLLSGIAPSSNITAWGGRGTYSVVGAIEAPRGLGVADAFARERRIDSHLEKVTIPGPSEITMLIEPRETARTVWPQIVELIRREIRELIAYGAREVQLDLPHVAMGLADDGWRTDEAVELVSAIFHDVGGIRRSIHLCYGDFMARSWTQNHDLQPLLPTLRQIAHVVDRVVLELSLPEQWRQRELLLEIDPRVEIAAGIVDVKSPRIQTVDELARMCEQLLALIDEHRLLLTPSCGLGRRAVPLAIGKTKAMVACAARF
jgi:5-methyltetrahydropteroyltriglutamate--homocysteine methyltransferase